MSERRRSGRVGIRRTVNQRPAATAAVAAAVIAGVVGFVSVRGCSSGEGDGRPTLRAFFTTDDGRTYFADDLRNVPPFTVNKPGDPNHGKVAVRAVVVRCKTGDPFVAVLEKFSDEDKRKIESTMRKQGDRASAMPVAYMGGARALAKKPGTGEKGWVRLSSTNAEAYDAVARPRCPDGEPEILHAD
jgi:hypothetical protein